MRPDALASWTLPVCLLLGALTAVPGCQGYAFEELPSSVIREKRHNVTITVSQKADILFVVDNSNSMEGEQRAIAESFHSFTARLNENFGDQYRIAVVTTGVESNLDLGCKPCPPDNDIVYSCINTTGESGRFQDLLGHNQGTEQDPVFIFTEDRECRIMDANNVNRCFYDSGNDRGVVLAGVRGCGWERGLAPMRNAFLNDDLLNTYNTTTTGQRFLRDDAVLVVVVISDEEDCGEVGDVSEDIQSIAGRICYYAAKGVSPDGQFSDPNGKLYQLTPVRDYYDFLLGLKGNRKGMVKFAAIVGMDDAANPSATQITFESDAPNAEQNYTCEVPNCLVNCDPNGPGYTGCVKACHAYPGTRYIALAEMFGLGEGENGFVDTICQGDFSQTLDKLGTFVACPRVFNLSEKILDPGLANILINDVPVPRYSCDNSTEDDLIECSSLADSSCGGGNCVETWSYYPPEDPPAPNAEGGRIEFAGHYDPCELITEGEINIELIYVTE